MTKEQQIDFIRAKCVEANIEIAGYGPFDELPVSLEALRPIRLADVLVAVQRKIGTIDTDVVCYEEPSVMVVTKWELKMDDISKQSSDCITYLYELLNEKV